MDIIQQISAIIAQKVVAQLKRQSAHPLNGKKLDMHCRVPDCKRRSRGPRFRYMCEYHGRKLNKTQQHLALVAYNARKANGR